jgi:DNA repair exonuclease SbcCD ATPase subunit
MTSPWNKERIGIRFNQKMQDLLTEEFVEYLDDQYDGPTDFLEEALRREKKEKPSLEERIERLDEKESEIKSKKQELLEKRRERQKENELEQKKRKLQDLQKELQRISRDGLTSREEARQQILEKYRGMERYSGLSDDEIIEKINEVRDFEQLVDEKSVEEGRVQELVKEIEELQETVADLNGGEYDWFIDPKQKVEVVA